MKMKFLSNLLKCLRPAKQNADTADPPKLLPASVDDDNAVVMQIQAIHSPDGRKVDNELILHMVTKILYLASYRHNSSAPIPAHITDHGVQEQLAKEKALADIINKVSCEMSLKGLEKENVHTITMEVLEMLSSFPWESKAVIALAAFALIFGEFMLVSQLSPNDELAKSIAHLKNTLIPGELKLEELFNLFKTMLDLATHIVEFKKIPMEHKPDTPITVEMVAAATQILPGVYWIIRGIAVLASIFINFHGDVVSSTEDSLDQNISYIQSNLEKRIKIFNLYADARIRYGEVYQRLVRLSQTPQTNNMEILKALINNSDGGHPPLFDSYNNNKKRGYVNLENLSGKVLCLLISSLNISEEMIHHLKGIFCQYKKPDYEVLWLPIMDDDRSIPWTKETENQFNNFQKWMHWFSLSSPRMLDMAVVMYIREHWQFTNKPIIVSLDPQGNVTNRNALHMIWIWRNSAFPFSNSREEQLWMQDKSWRFEFLMNPSFIENPSWEGKHICLYGGEDMEWMYKFTTLATEVTQSANIQLQLIYAGKSNREKVKKNMNIMYSDRNRFGDVVHYSTMWFFWQRLESMWYSRVNVGKSVEDDQIMQEVKLMLSFDSGNDEWAVFGFKDSTGDYLARANGDMVVLSLSQFDKWKHQIEDKGFIPALNEYLLQLHA